jgi:flagellum-specific ATP synthase
MQKIVSENHSMYAGFLRELITTYNANEELIRLSAYVKGSDSKVDMAISKKDAIDEFLKQRIENLEMQIEILHDTLKELLKK